MSSCSKSSTPDHKKGTAKSEEAMTATTDVQKQWEEFQNTFERMNTLLVENISAALLGTGGKSDAIAKPIPKFKVPTQKEVAFAAGEHSKEFKSLPQLQQLAFKVSPPVPNTVFERLPRPKMGDWLASHEERGQSIKSLRRISIKCWPHATYTTIEIVPVGEFIKKQSPPLDELRKFMELYFGVRAIVADTVPLDAVAKSGLVGGSQLLCGDAMEFLQARRVNSRTTFARIIVTMTDLTPGEGWNFVFGQAKLSSGVGVFSFARYSPNFRDLFSFGMERPCNELTEDEQSNMLLRACQTMVHESGHILGLKHCIYFKCLMNGSNGEHELAPLHCCPVCLAKLHAATRFDIIQRYEGLSAFYAAKGWVNEAAFCEERLQALRMAV